MDSLVVGKRVLSRCYIGSFDKIALWWVKSAVQLLHWTLLSSMATLNFIFKDHYASDWKIDDAATGLHKSLLVAVGPSSDFEAVYRLCNKCPPALVIVW